nr:hypothetical protein [Tanacetum cinerariifolium]
MEPKKLVQALKDPSWVEAMQEELLQFTLLNVWTLVDLPKDKWAIGIDYDEVIALAARIEAIRLFWAYASFKDFVVYQMDVKSAFLYGKIEEEKSDGIFISQDKYAADILKKFDLSTVKTASTLIEANKSLVKDVEAEDQTIVANSTTEAEFVAAANCYGQVTKISHSRGPTNLVANETVYKEGEDRMKRAATTTSSLEAEHDSAKVKKVNGQEQIQALVDKQKVIITEESIRRDLKFDDAKEVSTADPVTAAGEVVTAASIKDSAALTTTTTADVDDELTPTKTLIEIKAAKPKVISTAITTPRAKRIVFHEQVQPHKPTVSSLKDKSKAKMIEPEKPLKKKDQISLDEEVVRKLEAEMKAEIKEEERIAREKDEANRDVIKEWDDVQATINADRRKYFAAKRAEQKDFKGKSFDDIKKIFNKVYKRVNTFVDMDTEDVDESLKKTQAEGSSKRAGQELEQESAKKHKLSKHEQAKVAKDDTIELKRCLEIVPEDDDDVAIEATPISSKSPTIVDYKIYKEGRKSYFKIIRADGDSQSYLTFKTMFKYFNIKDLEVLRSIIKERFKKIKPVDDMENLLFQTLKTMFEPHVEDIIWKYQQGAAKVNNWKLFNSCGVYCVTTKTMVYYLLVENMYLFTKKCTTSILIRCKASVNAAYVQLVLLVYKFTAVFNKVNAAKSRVTTVVRVSTGGWIKWLEDQDMREMDDPNITMEEYIRLEEEKARRGGKVYNRETTTYGKIWCDEDVHDLRSVETEFPAIFYNDALTFEVALSCKPTVSPLNNNQIDFRISFDESNDEDYMQGEDSFECINKAMAFLSAIASRFPPSNNQLKECSSPINQATIQDGRVTVQQVQRRQNQSYAGIGNRGIATTSKGNVA